jgi:hypothetical protein
MAIKFRIMTTVELDLVTDDMRGIIRLWYNDDPPVKSDMVVVVTDTNLSIGESLKQSDLVALNTSLGEILDYAGMTLDDYEDMKNRKFHCDLKIPAEFIDAYTG